MRVFALCARDRTDTNLRTRGGGCGLRQVGCLLGFDASILAGRVAFVFFDFIDLVLAYRQELAVASSFNPDPGTHLQGDGEGRADCATTAAHDQTG